MADFISRGAFSGAEMNPGLALFVQNQQAQKELALEEQLKNAELFAMMERAKMAEEGATQRNEATNATHIQINEATNAIHTAIARDRLDVEKTFHQKDVLTGEQIDGINANNPGLNLPRVDGLPVRTAATLIGVYKSGQSDISRENRADIRNERMLNRQITLAENMEARRLANENANVERARLIAQAKKEATQRQDERKSFAAEMAGSLNTDENPKTGMPTRFSPTKLLEENPAAALALSEKAGRLGWPEKANVKPLRPFREKGWSENWSLYDIKKKQFEADKAQFQRNLKAPPTTGSGGASMNKGAPPSHYGIQTPKEFLKNPNALGLNTSTPTQAPTPATTQQVSTPTPTPTPSIMGGFLNKVGPQPSQIGPGPSAMSPPSSPPSTQGYFLYKGGQKVPVSADQYNRYIIKYGRPPE